MSAMTTQEDSIAGLCKRYRMFWLAHQGDDALRKFISANIRTASPKVICALIDVDIELRLLSSRELNADEYTCILSKELGWKDALCVNRVERLLFKYTCGELWDSGANASDTAAVDLPVVISHGDSSERRYELTSVLGRGATATVYRAVERRADELGDAEPRTVAVKVFHQPIIDEEAVKLAYEEWRTLAGNPSTHICVAYDYGVDSILGAFIVMPAYENGALADHHVPASEADIVRWMIDACRGVAGAHQFGTQHLDLKPSNCLVHRDGDIHIGDFGQAVTRSREMGSSSMDSAAGTVPFMAPEQYFRAGNWRSEAADLYGLGAVLYWLMTGRPPNGVELSSCGYNLYRAYRRPSQWRHGIMAALPKKYNEGLRLVCAKALEARPQDRYRSADEMLQDLDALCRKRAPRTAMPSRTRRIKYVLGQHRLVTSGVVIAFILSLLLVAGLYQVRQWELEQDATDAVAGALRLLETVSKDAQASTVDGSQTVTERKNRLEAATLELQNLLSSNRHGQSALYYAAAIAVLRGELSWNPYYGHLGDLQAADDEYATAIEKLSRTRPEDARWCDSQRALAAARQRRALVANERGDVEAALDWMLDGHEIYERMSQSRCADLLTQNDLAAWHAHIATVFIALGDSKVARQHLDKAALVLNRDEVTLSQTHLELQSQVERVRGDTYIWTEAERALTHYSKAKEYAEALCNVSHSSERCIRSLAWALEKIAHASVRMDHLEIGQIAAMRALELRRQSESRDPNDAGRLYHAGLAHERIAMIYEAQGELEKALEHYGESVMYADRIAELMPESRRALRGRAVTRRNVASVSRDSPDRGQVIEMLQTALRIDEELYELRGDVEAARLDLYTTLFYLIEAKRRHQSAEASRSYVVRMIEVLRDHANDPEVAPGERLEYAVYLLEAEPEDLRNPHEAKGVALSVVEELRGEDARSLLVLGAALRALDKEEEARAILERAREVAPAENEELLFAINHYLASDDAEQ